MKRNKLIAILMELELHVVNSLKRNLKMHLKEEEELGIKWEPWQTAKLRDLERLIESNKRIEEEITPVVEEVRKEFKKSIRQQLEEAFEIGKRKVTEEVIKIKNKLFGKKKEIEAPKELQPNFPEEPEISLPKEEKQIINPEIFTKEKPTPEDIKKIKEFEETEDPQEKHFFRTNDDKLEALIEETERSIDEPTKAVTRFIKDKYKEILEKAQVGIVTGTLTLEKAMDMAIEEFVRNGVTNIEYKDGSRRNIQSYVEMALRTANHRAFLMGEGKKRQELGIHTVLSSQAVTTCPICLKWQNKVMVDDVFSGGTRDEAEELKVPLVSEAMEDGFLHPNCIHNLLTYIPGISTIPKDVNQDEAKRLYELQQKQRKLELEIRKLKRENEGISDKEQIQDNKRRIKELGDEIKATIDPKQRREKEREVNRIHDIAKEKEYSKDKNDRKLKMDINTDAKGAIYGAYNDDNDPGQIKRDAHAELFYNELKNRNKEHLINQISNNAKIDKETVKRAYNHVFINKYDLGAGLDNFNPDYDMAESWRRLSEGKNIQVHDKIMLEHEALESIYMNEYNLKYTEAHDKTNLKYNYQQALDKWKESLND